MAKKMYIAKTALILQDAAGKDFRIEAGEAVALTPAQYRDVAAHVAVAEISDEDLAQAAYQPDGETPPEAEAQPETKPVRGSGKKEV